MIRGVHHTAISTGDLERSLAFYRDLLGFAIAMDHRWGKGTHNMDVTHDLRDTAARVVLLRGPNGMLEIFEYSSPTSAPVDSQRPLADHGITHFCLEVEDIQGE